MTTLREAAQQALEALEAADVDPHSSDMVYKAIDALRAALAEPQRTLTDEVIADLWFNAKIPGLTETNARILIRAAEQKIRGVYE